jgi:hypothetical protein
MRGIGKRRSPGGCPSWHDCWSMSVITIFRQSCCECMVLLSALRCTIRQPKTLQPSSTKIPPTFRFESDSANRVLVARFEGRLTNELLAESYRSIRKYSILTDALLGIWDTSAVTEFAVSSEFVRQLAHQEPAMPNAFTRPRVIVAPSPAGFGLARMFQIAGEDTRPLLAVVRTMHEALTEIRIPSPHFEPLD